MRLERLSWLYVAFACAAGVAHTEDIPKDVLKLARARAHMSGLLQRLPNYTCLQNIERTRRGPSGRMQLVDMVRMEVALVNGNELFAWPGSKKFQDTKLIDMVKGGAIGNGSFALHAKSVFQSNSPRFTFVGERIREDGRRTLRWDYVVPQFLSGYLLRSGGQEAIVGFHGSVWVDGSTLDAVRLEVHADDIPAHLKIHAASDAMDYQRVKLGEEEFLLPAKSELTVVGMDAHESVNRTTFTGCRQYTGESVISFDDLTPDATEAAGAPERTLHLPAGVNLQVALETPVEQNRSAVGDPITAILKKEVKLGSGLVAPKGAFLHGRVTHMRRQDGQAAGWAVGFEFFELEWENTRARLRAELVATPSLETRTMGGFQVRTVIAEAAREAGTFFVPGQRLSVGRGFPMHWRTQPPDAEDKQ
jgi:hypothetical protein